MHRALVKFILRRRSHGSARDPPAPQKLGVPGLAPPSPLKPSERAGAPLSAAAAETGCKRRAQGHPLEEEEELLLRRRRKGAYQPAGTAARLAERRGGGAPARGTV